MSQLSEAVEIIRKVLQLNLDSADNKEVKVSAAESKEIQARIIDKFGCTKKTAYYYYFYRGKKFLTEKHNIKFVTDRSAPKKKKSADQIVKDQIANLEKQGPVSPFRL
jgi:hypothetical protein